MSGERKPDGLPLPKLKDLHRQLKQEIRGEKREGHTAYSVLRRELGLRGSRTSVLHKVELIINSRQVSRD